LEPFILSQYYCLLSIKQGLIQVLSDLHTSLQNQRLRHLSKFPNENLVYSIYKRFLTSITILARLQFSLLFFCFSLFIWRAIWVQLLLCSHNGILMSLHLHTLISFCGFLRPTLWGKIHSTTTYDCEYEQSNENGG